MERNAHRTAALYPSQVEEEREAHDTDDDLPFAIQALSASFDEAISRSYDDSDNDKSNNYSKTNSDDSGASDDGLSSGIQALSFSLMENSESDDYLPSAIQALSMSLQESDMGRPHEALMAGLEDSSSTSLENQEAITTSQYSVSEIVRSPSKEIESSDWHEEQVLKRALHGSTEIVFGNEDEAGHEIEGDTPRDVEKEWDETKSDDLTFGIKALSMSLLAEEKLPGPCLDKTIIFAPGAIGLQLEPVREDPKYACRVIRFVDGGPKNPGQARMSGKIMPGDAIISAEANGIVGTSYEVIMQILTDAWATRTLIFQSMWDSSILDAPSEATLRPIEKSTPPSVGFQQNILSTKSRLKEDTIDKNIDTLLSFQKEADQEPPSLHDSISVDTEDTKVENALTDETSGWKLWALGDAKPSSSHGPSMTLQDASTLVDVMMLPNWKESKVESPSTDQSNTTDGWRFWSIRDAEEDPSPALIFNESSPFRHMEQSSEPKANEIEDSLTVRHSGPQGWQFWALGTTNPSPRVEQSSPLQGTKVQVTAVEENNKDIPTSMDEDGWLFWSRLDAHQSQRSPLLELSSHAQTQVPHHSQPPSCDKITESYLSCDGKEASISLATQPEHGKEESQNLISEKQTGFRKQSGPETKSQADGGITRGQVRQVIEKGHFAGRVCLFSVQLDSATPSQLFHASLSETISSKTPLPCALSYDEQERQLASCENDSEVTIMSMWRLGQIVQGSDFEGKVHLSSIRSDPEALHQHSHGLLPQAVSDKRLLRQLPYDQLETQLNIVVKSQQAAETKLRAKEEIKIQKENEAEAIRSKAEEDARIAEGETARLEGEEAERLAHVAEEKARQSAEEGARQRAEKEARLRAEEQGRQVAEATTRGQVRQVIEKGHFAGKVCLSSVQLDSATPSQHFHASLSETISSKTPLPCALSYDEQERQLASCENDSEVTIMSMWRLGQIVQGSDFEGKVHLSSIRSDPEALHQHSHSLLPQAVSDKRLLRQLPYDQLETQLNIVVKSQQAAETKLRAKEEIRIQKENAAEAARSEAEGDARIAAAENARLKREEAKRLAHFAGEKARQSAEEEARKRKENEARLRAEEQGRQVMEEEVRFHQDCRPRAKEEARNQKESRNQKEREPAWTAEQAHECQIQEQARMQQEKEDVQPEKTIVFTPGPVGLQLEAVIANPNYACRVVRFVDGGPKNPGQARKSGTMNPGDYVIRAEAEGIVGAGSYDEIMRVLEHASFRRTLTIRSVWKSSLLDTKPEPKSSDPVKSVDRSPVSTLVESSLPEAKPESNLSVQTTDQPHAPPLVESNSPALAENFENSLENKSNVEYVPQEVTTIAEPSESRKMILPRFETLRKNYFSIEKLRPIQQKHAVEIKEPEKKRKPALPQHWVNNGAPLDKKALSKEDKLARDKRYQEEVSRLMFEAEARRRTIQAEEAQKSWNFENVVLGVVALTANSTVGVVSLAASAVSVCLKSKRHFDDEECSYSKKDK